MYKRLGIFFAVIICLTGCSSLKQTTRHTTSSSRLTDAEEQQFYYYYYEAFRLRDNQRYDQALETFLLCYEIDSLNPGLNSDLGLFYASMGYMNEAIKHLEKTVELEPSNWWYNMRLINMLAEQKQWERAIELTVKLQKRYPYKEDVYYMLASLYTETKQYDKAIGAYNQMEKIVGINEALSFEKFRLYLQSGKLKKGIAEIDRLINEYPSETRYQVLRGDIYLEQKMPEEAYNIYQSVLASDPQNAYVYISLSDYYNTINEPDKALESIVNALKNEQLDVNTKMEILGKYVENLIADEKKIDETEDLFKLLVDRYPLEEQVHIYYAIFLQFQERYDEMIEVLKTILYINPKNDGAWNQLIQLYYMDKKPEKVIEVASKAIENMPEDLRWYIYKSSSQLFLQDYESALETSLAAAQYIETSTNAALKSDIYTQTGDIYYHLNKKDEAFEAYEKALKVFPNNVGAMNNYAYYLSLEKTNLKRAELLSARTVELDPKNSTFLDTYAWILYQQGNYSLAKFYIERAMDNADTEDDHNVIIDHYGDILWKNGDHEKAVEMWEKALKSGLNTEEVKQKVEQKRLVTEEAAQ